MHNLPPAGGALSLAIASGSAARGEPSCRAYVTNERDGSVSVVDVCRRVALRSGRDPEQLALSPDGGRPYAANEDAGTASVTELPSGASLATLGVGIEPEGAAARPDGDVAYTAAETSSSVSAIDAAR